MQNTVKLISLLLFLTSCANLHQIESLPKDEYTIQADFVSSAHLRTTDLSRYKKNKLRKILVEQTDSLFTFTPLKQDLPATKINIKEVTNLRLYRHTFDIDILTIPFKIRPSVSGFPKQLNANFSAAVYLGRRRGIYQLNTKIKNPKYYPKLSGVGLGYGAFLGIGGVTMNPFVTQGKITYEYDGLVINSGIAGIYDAKKFNIGLAAGLDYLADKNRQDWIYHKKLWFGVLLGINLN